MESPPPLRSDAFRDQAAAYARFRPSYPPALFAYLADQAAAAERAVDVGAGTGQAARGLSQAGFGTVLAVEPERAMLRAMAPRPGLLRIVGTAEAMPIRDRSADLVCAAQAAHWFDMAAFAREAQRILRPGGTVALWTYGFVEVEPEIDRLLRRFHDVTLAADWEPGRTHVVERYRRLAFPFAERAAPAFTLERFWTADNMLGYLSTWSGLARHRRRTGSDPLPELADALRVRWGDTPRPVRWPLALRIGEGPP